jgi:hypothetical protein
MTRRIILAAVLLAVVPLPGWPALSALLLIGLFVASGGLGAAREPVPVRIRSDR